MHEIGKLRFNDCQSNNQFFSRPPNGITAWPFSFFLCVFFSYSAVTVTQHRTFHSRYGFRGYSQRPDCQVKRAMLEMRGHGGDGIDQRRSSRHRKRGMSPTYILIMMTLQFLSACARVSLQPQLLVVIVYMVMVPCLLFFFFAIDA